MHEIDRNEILEAAKSRLNPGENFDGHLTPTEAYELLKDPSFVMLDIRFAVERTFVGVPVVDNVVYVEYIDFSTQQVNLAFKEQVEMLIPEGKNVVVICRACNRSPKASRMVKEMGIYGVVLNVLDGFEGAFNNKQQRGLVNGWKASGLPWRNI